MLDWLFSASIPVLLAVSSVTILSAGCLIARWLARRPAGALRSVIVCGVLAIALPAAFAGVRAAGWGLLPRDDSPSIDDSGKSIHVLASGMPEGTTLDFLDQKLAGDAYPSMADEKVDAANESRAVVTRSVERDPQTAAAAVALRAVIASIDWAAAGWTVAGLWFFASLVLTVRLIPAFVRGRHLARTSEHVTNEARLRSMQRAARRLGIVQVELRQTGAICSPVVWCWGSRPIVLVPATPLGDSTTDLVAECVDWESVFVHELAHWRRGDHWAALLGELLIAAFPWNPLAWMMRQRIAFLADCACDEEVMRLGTSPARYAESLMLFSCEHVSLALGVASAKSLLFRRICAILAPECGRRPDRGWSWLLSAAIASALAITFLQPSARRQALAESPEPLWPQNPPADERLPATAAKWDERIAALPEGDWRSAFAVGGELASLPADEGFDILSRVWPKMSIDTRQQMMKAFRFKGSNNLPDLHARLIDVMHLGMTGSQPKVQEWSINYLREIAFEDFSQDINAYHKWYAANHGRNPRDVMMENCRRYIGELRSGDPKALDKLSDNDFRNHVARSPDLQQAMIEAGAPDLVERWLKAPPTTEKGQRMLAALIASLKSDEAYMRAVILPAAREHALSSVQSAAIRALGQPGNEWAVQPLLEILVDQYKKRGTAGHDVDYFAIGMALGELGDARAIPTIIGVIQDDNSYETVYGLGYFALSKLTGVRYDESHEGAWWTNWWDANKSRYAPEVSGMAIPNIQSNAAKGEPIANAITRSSAAQGEKTSPAALCRIGEDDNKRYYLIGDIDSKNAPKDGYRLLLVLPGGDGGPGFHDFVKNIYANALPPGYVVAQLVAPQWSDDENRIVWPTQKSADKNMKFPTERFIDDVVRDVARQARINKKRVYALGWSSGGPPVYYAAMQVNSPLAGAFVAMSVFKPDQLPPTDNVKNQAFYVLHSPTDFINMNFPNAAIAQLSAAGAKTKLQTYEGGHGWHGDVFGMIRTGVEWLENPTQPEPSK